MPSSNAIVRHPRVVIIGAGFGGLSTAKRQSSASSYVTFQRGTRLITGPSMPMPVPMDPTQPNQARHAA